MRALRLQAQKQADSMTPEEYKESGKSFKSDQFNIRGNPENKKLITKLTKDYGFKNEGITLDYIFTCFQQKGQPSVGMEELAGRVTDLDRQLRSQIAANNAASERIRELENAAEMLSSPALLPISFSKLKEELEKALPKMFLGTKIEQEYPQLKELSEIKLSNYDAINIMATYCEYDPCEKFPHREPAQSILLKHLKHAKEAAQIQTEENKSINHGKEQGASGDEKSGAGDSNGADAQATGG